MALSLDRMSMMNLTQRMEEFSRAYIAAVSAHAGFQISRPGVDDDSVDGIILSKQGKRPRIEFQVKSTGQNLFRDENIAFPLSLKNYTDLRTETIIPRILIVVMMPDSETRWLEQSEETLCLRRCAYWMSLSGYGDRQNVSTVTVHLPRSQRFTSGGLVAMMARVEAEGMP